MTADGLLMARYEKHDVWPGVFSHMYSPHMTADGLLMARCALVNIMHSYRLDPSYDVHSKLFQTDSKLFPN